MQSGRWFVLVGSLVACGGPESASPSDAANTMIDAAVVDMGIDVPLDGAPILSDLVGNYRYIKASNTGAQDLFGGSLAMSGDGQTIAVGAMFGFGNGTSESDDSLMYAGAVYVFARSGATWVQQAYVKAEQTDLDDRFGYSVSLSYDGNTLAVGSHNEDSCATTVNGDQTNNDCSNSGAAYIFVRTGSTWSQQAYVKASNANVAADYGRAFGFSIALSSDGGTLAVGSVGDASKATGIDGNQSDYSKAQAGAVYVYTRSGSTWTQQAYVKASNTDQMDEFGSSVALSANGNVMAVGAFNEGSNGINANQANNSTQEAGAVYTFRRSGTTWSQDAYIKASNPGQFDVFGSSLALSASGNTMAVGAPGEHSAATGIDGDQTDDSQISAGAVYAFARASTTSSWSQQAYIKGTTSYNSDYFGRSVSLSANGYTLAVGAPGEISAGSGLTTPSPSGGVGRTGATYTFRRTPTTWEPLQYMKATTPGDSDYFGSSVSMSADATTLAVAAVLEDSAATGIGGDETDNTKMDSGALYVIE